MNIHLLHNSFLSLRKIQFSLFLILFSLTPFFSLNGWGQTTVTYTMQDTYFPTQFNDGGDFFDNGSTELGMWANTGNKNTAAWRTFRIAGNNNAATARTLRVGDVFKITVSCTRAFGQIGFSLNAAGTQGTSYANRISGSRLYFNTDNYGTWYVNRSGGNTNFSYTPIQSTYKDYIFTIKITSSTTADVFLTVDGTDYRAYNLTMNGTGNIDAFSIYGSDLWDGDSNDNAYWKQTASVTNSGSVELGYYLTSGTYTPGLVSNGLAANSTSTSSTNNVLVGGDAGSSVVLNQANTYTGTTTVNANATLKLGVSSTSSTTGPLGSTTGTTVSSGGVLDMNGFSLTSSATEALTLNGTGISSGGALTNTSGTSSTWAGAIAMGSNSSTGGSGNLTISGILSGAFSLTKVGAGTLTLSNSSNSYSGGTVISGGTVSISNAGHLGNTSGAITLGSGSTSATLNITTGISRTVLNVTDGSSAGVINVASGQTFTLTNLNTASGTNNATKIGKSGTGTLTLSGAGTYVGQIQIGEGNVIVSNNSGLGTNNSTVARGIDLGLNVGDVSQANNVSVLATTGITVPQSIYVAPNTTSATRTIGLSGASGTATYNNEIYLDGNLTVSGTGTVVLSGRLTNTGGLISNATTVNLQHNANNYSGTTTINAGSELRLNPSANATFSSQIVLNGGTLGTTGITASRTWTSSSTLNVSASSTIALESGTAHTLTIAASNGVSWTSGIFLTITNWAGAYNGTSGTAGKIFVGSSATGLTTTQLSQIIFYNGTSYYQATLLSTGELVPTSTIAAFYWGGSGTWTSANTWSLTSGGALNQTWISGRDAVFNVVNSTITGASTNVSSITANENVTFTAGGTLAFGTSGTGIATISVASGKIFNLGGQGLTTSATAGYIKNGPGTIQINGSTFAGGVTLNDGMIAAGGINAMGAGGSLTINGGTIAGTANRSFTGKFTGGINIGGNFTLGSSTSPALSTATLLFDNATSLGTNATRTITLGGTGVISWNGIISGTNSSFVINSSVAGAVISLGAANSYTGSTTIGSNATIRLGATNAIPVGGVGLILNGGTLSTGATTGFSLGSSPTNVGTLDLAANSTIALGTGNHSLYFAASNGVTWNGSTLTITGWTGNGGESGTAGKIFVGNSSSGLTSGQLAKITINGQGVTQLSTGEIVPRATIYRSAQTGNWSSTSTWERSLDDGASWIAAVATPTSADGTITIRSSHTITIAASITIDQTTVDNGATVIHSSANTVTLANGTGTDLTINGLWSRTSSNSITINASATIQVGSTGIYEHAISASGGSIPIATWDANSTLKIATTATMSSYPTGLDQTFGKVEVNCASQTSSNVNFFVTNAVTEVKVISTGSGSIELNNGSNGITITGNYIQTGGTVKVNYSGSLGIGNATFTVGDFSIEGGTFIISDNPGSSYYGQLIVNGNYSQSGGTINFLTGNGATYLDVKGNMSLTGGNFTTSFTSANTGIYFIGTGAQSLTVGNLSSYTSALNTRFYYKTSSGPTALNETYSSTSSQNTISGTTGTARSGFTAWPTSGSLINNLTINNSAGVTLSTAKQVNGALTLTSGKLTTNGNVLTLINTSTGSSSSYVVADATGTVTMNGVSSAKTIPIGTASSYAPLVVSAGSSTNYSTYVTSTLPCAVGNANQVVNLAWGINGSNVPSNVVFQWNSTNQGSSFNPANTCEIGQYGSSCPYTATSIGVASGSGPYTLSVGSGLASGSNLYSVGNLNSIVPAGPSLSAVTMSSALSTTYGTASSGVSFTANGTNLSTNITATAQTGYEVSTSSGSGYGSSVTVANGTTVWVRLAATQAAGDYNGASAVVLSSTGATSVNVTTSSTGNSVSQKALTISGLTANNKVYDATTSVSITGSAAYSGLVNGESFSVSGAPTWAFATKTVGTAKAITQTGSFSAPSANYSITQPTYTADITSASLTITGATASNKVYDGTTTAAISGGSLSGVLLTDVVTLTQSGTFASANVANGISVTSTSSISGADAGNYTLTQPSGLIANITVKSLTITANNVTKVFGAALTGGSGSTAFSSSGLVGSETIGSVTIAYGSGASSGDATGTYSGQVTASSATGGTFNAGNYSISYLAGDIIVVDVIAAWDFTTSTASSSNVNITAPVISQGNNNGTTTLITSTSASSGYTGASGGNNAGAAARAGSLSTASNGSAYFEFTITPNSGVEVTIKEVSFGSRGTATAPQNFTLRSSSDSYSNDIFTGTLSATSTWELKSNTTSINEVINSARTYRIYGYNGSGSPSANTANWRIDDIKIQGFVKSVPQLSTPTSTSVGNTSASLGATITSDGGATITARGTVYGTSASPTTNSLAEGGTSVAAFTHSRTGLTANTLYYYRGYATNSVGTGYSADGTFTTLHNAPTVGSGSNATATSIDASWSAPSGGSETFTYEIQVDNDNDFSSPTFTQSGISSATTSITATGLTSNTTYFFRVRANNAGGSSAWSSTSTGYATLAAVTPTLSGTLLTAFGNVCINTTTSPNSFTINGATLTSADVTVSSLSGFTFSTTAGGTYTSSLTLSQAGGTYSQDIYVKFNPTAVQSYDGNIVIGGGGASSVNVAASGSGNSGSVSVTTTAASSIYSTGASTGGSSISTSCGTITSKGVAYGTSANPTTPVTSDGTGTGDFTSLLSGLTPNTLYNYRAYATNSNSVTSYGSNLTFTTLHNAPTVGTGSSPATTGFTANWTAPTGGGSETFTYEVAVSTSSSFASTLSSQSGIASGTTSYQFTGLSNGTTYYFRVRTNNAGGSSNWSAISSGITTLAPWENFEIGSKGSYTAGNVTCSAGNWNLSDALIGTSSNDRKLGSQSVRIQSTGVLSMNFDVTNGISTLTIYHGLFSTDASSTWRLEVSNNNGSSWDAYVSSDITTSSTTLTAQTFNIDLCGTLRFRIVKRSGTTSQRINFDDIVLVEKAATPSAPTTSAQTFCSASSPTVSSLTATGTSIQWYSAATGGSGLASNTALVDGTSYYASQTVSGCESSRTSAAITVRSEGTWIGGNSTDWSNAANWCGGVPTSSTNVTIPSGTANSAVISSSVSVNTLTINSGATLSTSGTPTITIANNGSFTNNGTFTAGSSKVSFAGNGTVTGTVAFNDVDIAGGVNFGTASTVNGTLSMNSGSYINTNAPTYGTGSTLKYNTGGTYGRSTEWSTTSGAGAPFSVQLSNNTTLNYPNSANGGANAFSTNLSLGGNLTIDNGSALYMDYGGNANKSGRLDVLGNILLNGNLSLGNASGGDIKVGGNWTRNSGSTFNANGRAVFINGTGTSIITGNGGETFPYLVNDKTSGTIQLGSNVTLTSPSGGNALTHKSTASLDLNGFDLTFSGPASTTILANGACNVTGTGNIFITNNSKTLTQSSGTWTFGSNVVLRIQNGLNFGNNISTVNGTLEINSGGYVTSYGPNYGSGSLLKYNIGNAYGRSVEWYSDVVSGTGVPSNVLISSGTTLDLGANDNNGRESWVTGNLTLDGTLSLAETDQLAPLNVSGNVIFNNGTLILSTTAGGDIKVGGNWSGTGSFTPNSRAVFFNGTGNQTISRNDNFPYLFVNKSSGTLTFAGAITLNNKLTYSNGTIALGVGGSIDASGASAEVEFANSSVYTLPTGMFTGNVNKLTLNGNGGVNLSENLTVTGNLTLTNGDLNIGANTLTLGSSSSVSSGSSSSHVNATSTGEIRKIYSSNASFIFPVGDGTNYTPATLNFTAGSSLTGASDDFVGVRLKTSKVTDMNSANTTFLNRSWFIEPGAGLSGYTYTVNLKYADADVSGTESNIKPVKKSSGVWHYPGDASFEYGTQLTGTSTSGTDYNTNILVWSGLTSFSEFGGGGQGGPLPVELIYFNAICEEDVLKLNWSTASEKNSSHFDIEKSQDGIDWILIGSVPAAGNSNEEITYSFQDNTKSYQEYYRLNQFDFDGKNKIYGPISADCKNENSEFMTFPNPSEKNGFSVVLNSNELSGLGSILMTDSKGNLVYQKQVEIQKGISLWQINESDLAPGIYFIKITNGSNSTKVLKHTLN